MSEDQVLKDQVGSDDQLLKSFIASPNFMGK